MHVEGLLPDYPVFVFSYFIKLRTKLAIWKILPATHSNSKQNIQFQNKNVLAVRVNHNSLWCLTFPCSMFPLQITAWH